MYPSANVASMAGNVDRHQRRPGRSFRWIVVVGTISLDGSWRQAPCGFATSSDPTLPPTPETFEIPLVDAPVRPAGGGVVACSQCAGSQHRVRQRVARRLPARALTRRPEFPHRTMIGRLRFRHDGNGPIRGSRGDRWLADRTAMSEVSVVSLPPGRARRAGATSSVLFSGLPAMGLGVAATCA